mgnify:FL=1
MLRRLNCYRESGQGGGIGKRKDCEMKNIVLIGMPGSGKSTIGVVLAKVLGYRFVDTDLVIQEQEGKLLQEIIAERGNDGFLALENEVNSRLDVSRSVIATGGSVIYGQEAMEHLRKNGWVVYLKLDYEDLKKRLGNLRCRGVVLREGQTLKDLYRERIPFYEKYAHIEIDEKNLGVEETMEEIVRRLPVLEDRTENHKVV